MNMAKLKNKLTLAVRGLEEPRNSQELLIESVGPVFLFCVLCHIVSICCFSVVLKYYIPLIHACIDGRTVIREPVSCIVGSVSTDRWTDSRN